MGISTEPHFTVTRLVGLMVLPWQPNDTLGILRTCDDTGAARFTIDDQFDIS